MRQLYLLRHGKSDWHTGVASDHERPLAERGERAARAIGELLSALGKQPDLVISSSAVRAHETARLAAEAGGWSAEIVVTPDFYHATPGTLLEHVQGAPDECDRVLLVGHEPTWSEAVGLFIGQAGVRMVTAALARVDLGVAGWSEARFGAGELAWLVTPKLLARSLS